MKISYTCILNYQISSFIAWNIDIVADRVLTPANEGNVSNNLTSPVFNNIFGDNKTPKISAAPIKLQDLITPVSESARITRDTLFDAWLPRPLQ